MTTPMFALLIALMLGLFIGICIGCYYLEKIKELMDCILYEVQAQTLELKNK